MPGPGQGGTGRGRGAATSAITGMRGIWLRHGASPEEVMRRKLTGLVEGQKKDFRL